ncbi:MAG: DUF4873 domain-containing protein [Mycobacteriaceae bacterium]|nr:DUF4873 domain-containing protein [Mycobacteriaceae bacterium]
MRYRPRRRRLAAPDLPADAVPAPDYTGPALLDIDGDDIAVTAALSGRVDPIDGRYHWHGRVAASFGELPTRRNSLVTLTLPGGTPTTARVDEHDPWGNLRVTGAGPPPFPA